MNYVAERNALYTLHLAFAELGQIVLPRSGQRCRSEARFSVERARLTVAVRHARHQLLEEVARHVLRKTTLIRDAVE